MNAKAAPPWGAARIFDEANRLLVAGRLADAEAAYRQVLMLDPKAADAYANLGVTLTHQNRADDAAEAYRQAIRIRPAHPAAHSNLGAIQMGRGDLEGAAASFRKAVAARRDYPEAHSNLGAVLQQLGRAAEAEAACRRAIALKPDYVEAHGNLGLALKDLGRREEAVASFRNAVTLRPDYARGHVNLGKMLQDLHRYDEAAACYRRAIEIEPRLDVAQYNLGVVLAAVGDYDGAVEAYRRALAVTANPDHAESHCNLAFALLARGDWIEGWKEYEWRQRRPDYRSVLREGSQPAWSGELLAGKTILLHDEQGYGDTIQFVRYAQAIARQGGSVVLAVPPELEPLLVGLPWIARFLRNGESLAEFDFHCPLMGLPHRFGTTPETVPAEIPYLQADAAAVERWRARLDPAGGFRVGLAWAGRPTHANDRNRSMPLDALAPLAGLAGITLFGLQRELRPGDDAVLNRMGVENLGPALHDFAETAAAMTALDLVISVDTSVAHLAGALGRPTWLLLPAIAEWRWLVGRQDTPWYPTMRLFRQSTSGDWDGVVRVLAKSLEAAARPGQ